MSVTCVQGGCLLPLGEVIAAELNWTTFDGLGKLKEKVFDVKCAEMSILLLCTELRDFPHRNEITHILRSVDIIIAADGM